MVLELEKVDNKKKPKNIEDKADQEKVLNLFKTFLDLPFNAINLRKKSMNKNKNLKQRTIVKKEGEEQRRAHDPQMIENQKDEKEDQEKFEQHYQETFDKMIEKF